MGQRVEQKGDIHAPTARTKYLFIQAIKQRGILKTNLELYLRTHGPAVWCRRRRHFLLYTLQYCSPSGVLNCCEFRMTSAFHICTHRRRPPVLYQSRSLLFASIYQTAFRDGLLVYVPAKWIVLCVFLCALNCCSIDCAERDNDIYELVRLHNHSCTHHHHHEPTLHQKYSPARSNM